MELSFMYSKIHRATVTNANLNYEGSISICPDLIEAAGLFINQKVDVLNCNCGSRLSTYVIEGKKGEICLNGAAARLNQPGDLVIIVAYCQIIIERAKDHSPNVVFVDSHNQITLLKNQESN